MRQGRFADGEHVLRAKIDMASPNINLPRPGRCIASPRRAPPHRRECCIYPTYAGRNGVSDALENHHALALHARVRDHRPLYECSTGASPRTGPGYDGREEAGPAAAAAAAAADRVRALNLTYVVLSKRKLIQLVEEKHVEGWDDPRMPTLVGARRRGFTPEGFRLFAERIGVAKADSWIEILGSRGLHARAPDEVAAQDRRARSREARHRELPVGKEEECEAPTTRKSRSWAGASCALARAVIEREDFSENPPKGYFRLFPATRCACATAISSTCTGCDKDAGAGSSRCAANTIGHQIGRRARRRSR